MQNHFLNLNNKVAAVIGASSGIGRATALLLAKQGAAVVLCARRADELAQTAALIRAAGGADTDMAGNAEQKAWAAGLHAVKRIAQPEEIAAVIAFLASPAAGFVTGAALFADGGNSSVK